MSDSFQTLAALAYTLLGMTLLAACGYGLHRLARWLEGRGCIPLPLTVTNNNECGYSV